MDRLRNMVQIAMNHLPIVLQLGINRLWNFINAPITKNQLIICAIYIAFVKLGREIGDVGNNYEQCVGDFMKRNDVLEPDFNVPEFNKSRKICDIFVNIDYAYKLYKISKFYEIEKFNAEEMKCIQRKISDSSFSEKILTLILHQSASVITRHELKNKKNLNDSVVKHMTKFEFECRYNQKLHYFIDLISKDVKTSGILKKQEIFQDYCFKTYIRKHHLLQSTFDLIPSFDLSELEPLCFYNAIDPYRNLIEKRFWDFLYIPTETEICSIAIIRQFKLTEKIMAITFAASYGMTEDQKKIERIHVERILYKVIMTIRNGCLTTATV